MIQNYTQIKSISKDKLQSLPDYSPQKNALLGNREIDKRYVNIYKKYLRKHIAQYSLTVGTTEGKPLEKRRLQKLLSNAEFKLKRKNDITLKSINQTLCSCGRDTHLGNTSGTVDIKETATTRRLKGLKSCGNNSACPVCAAKLSSIRGNQLKELMSIGRENGRSYMLVVSTIPHKAGEALESTLNQVIDMSNFIFNQREYKAFKKLSKCRFVHGGLENMVSFKNGLLDWHPHKNYLLDFDILISEVIKNLGLNNEVDLKLYVSRMMTFLGQKYLEKENIQKSLLSPYLQQEEKSNRIHVKGGVTASLEFDDGYIAKWGLDAEMTSGIYKDGRFSESFHPFNLLDFIHEDNKETTKEQKYQCIKAFQEFVIASRGKWWFYFGRGAIAYYNELYGAKLKVKKDADELLTLEDDGDLIYFLSHQEWLDFEPTPKKIGIALSLSSRQDILEFIFEHIELNRIRKMEVLE